MKLFVTHIESIGAEIEIIAAIYLSVTFKTTGKFVSVFVRLILGKVGIGRYTGPRWKSDVR